MRLILIEPAPIVGHRPIYIRSITETASSRGWEVRLLTTPEGSESSCCESIRNLPGVRIVGELRSIKYPLTGGFLAKLNFQRRYFAEMRNKVTALFRRQPADFVYLSNLDPIIRVAPLLGSPFRVPFGGFLAQAYFHLRDSGVPAPKLRHDYIDEWLFRRLLRSPKLRTVLTTDDTLPRYVATRRWIGSDKVSCIPELTTMQTLLDRQESRARLGISRDAFVVLCYGGLAARKGVHELLAAARSPACPHNSAVLLAGRQEPALAERMKSGFAVVLRRQNRLFELNRFLSDEEERLVFSAADVVWLGYVGYRGISGVTMQAAVTGRPAIACKEGIVGYWVDRYQTGLTINVSDPGEVANAIQKLKQDASLRTRFSANGVKLRANCDVGSFARAVCDAIANALRGAGRSPESRFSAPGVGDPVGKRTYG